VERRRAQLEQSMNLLRASANRLIACGMSSLNGRILNCSVNSQSDSSLERARARALAALSQDR
jgi:hypothetical protein